MTSKFLDLSAITLSSTGQPDFGNADLLPLADELTYLVSGGGPGGGGTYGPTNPTTCNNTNTDCTNGGNCSSSSNTNCKNTGSCLFDQWP